ncbi:MAG: acetyltransferase [Eggerthellaceae bacterium]|jgi:UDP-2-acetamido-3-amino-2,3-dideoxy-glucuronate N-acetyltransferase|nr:acetyltransferase [Eggerthellaceae bacterium]
MSEHFIHESAFVDEGAVIGEGTSVWHFCHLQAGAVVGSNCSLGQNVYVGSNAVIGDGVKVQNNVSVYEGVVLEDYVFCGPSCVFTNDLTPRAKYPKGSQGRLKTRVRTGASIGANATIVCGTEIGKWAIIGAGAVVVKDVPAYALMLGVPAQRRGWVCECGTTLPASLRCDFCNREYQETEKGLVEFDDSI